jgi:hypothetical protein
MGGLDDEEALRRVIGALEVKLEGLLPSAVPAHDLAAELMPLWKRPTETIAAPGSRPAWLPGKIVVRDEDLKLLDAVLDGLKASVGVGFFLSGAPAVASATAATGIAAVLIKLIYNAAMKGVALNGRSHAVLAALAAHRGGLTAVEIAELLAPDDPTLNTAAVNEILIGLSAAPARSGKVALVWEASGRWRTTGV